MRSTGDSDGDVRATRRQRLIAAPTERVPHAAECGFSAQDGIHPGCTGKGLSPGQPSSRAHFREVDRAVERGAGGLQLFRTGDPLTWAHVSHR